MTHDELIKRLQGFEWNDAEFKKGQSGVPDSAFETVSAFSNTSGGWLVFGVQEGDDEYEIVGVIEIDKVQNDFLSALRSAGKLNRTVSVNESAIDDEGKTLLVFYVPEAGRRDKPIYLKNDIRQSFIRRGGCDERCTREEIERFLRDAAADRHDGQAKVFAYATRTGRITTLDAKMVTSLPGRDARAVLDHLVTQALLQPLGGANTGQFSLATHLMGRFSFQGSDQAPQEAGRLVTDQPPSGESSLVTGDSSGSEPAQEIPQPVVLKELSETQWSIVLFCEAPQPLAAIMEAVKVTHRSFFKRKHLDPLIAAGVLALRHPDNPNHPEQAYVLSEAGIALKALRPKQPEPESRA